MSNETTWTLRVLDASSVPARNAGQSIAGVTREVKGLTAAAQAFQRTGIDRGAFANVARDQKRLGAEAARAAAAQQRMGAQVQRASRGWQSGARSALASHVQDQQRAVQTASSAWTRMHMQINEANASSFRQLGSLALGVGAAVVGIASGIASMAFQLGRSVLEMIRFRESAVTTLGVLGGGQGAGIGRIGSAAYRQATAIARATPTDQRTAVELQSQVYTGGFRGAGQHRALAAALDAGALNANDSTASRRFLIGLSQMRGSARLSDQDMRQTTEAAGIDRTQAMRRAAGFAGVTQRTGETDLAYQRRIDQARRAGRITGAHGVQGVEAQIEATTHRRLGGFAQQQGATLSGSMSNIGSALSELVTTIDGLENLPGVVRFKNLLNQVAATLNGSNAAGQRLQATVRGVIDGAFGALGSIDPNAILGGVQRFLRVVQSAVPYVTAFGRGLMTGMRPAFQALSTAVPMLLRAFGMFGGGGGPSATFLAFVTLAGRGVGMLVGVFATLIAAIAGGSAALFGMMTALGGFFATVLGALGTAAASLFQSMYGVASSLVDGFVAGLREQWGRLTGELTTLAQALPAPVRRALGIQSPSRVFAEIGRHVAGGMALGIDSGAGQVQAAMGALAEPPQVNVGGVGRSGPLVGSLTVQVTAGNRAEEIAESVRSTVLELFADLMGQAELAGGP